MNGPTRALLFATLALAACSSDDPAVSVPLPPGAEEAKPPPPSVVVLYAPGLDLARIERGIRDGYLPNLKRLRLEGTLLPLRAAGSASFWSGAPSTQSLAPEVKWLDGRAAIARADFQVVPEKVPAFEPVAPFPSFADDLGQAGFDVVLLGAPYPLINAASDRVRVLPAGLPAASFDAGRFVFIRETESDTTRVTEVPGGRVIVGPPNTSSQDSAVFVIEVDGPPAAQGGEPLRARVEIAASRDRMSARVRSGDDVLDVIAGRFSRPLRVRFEPSRDVALYARLRVYLRPTGREKLECYVEPVELDPVLPPEWTAIAKPADFAGALERLHGYLPRIGPAFPTAALNGGLLDPRDGAAALDAAFLAERGLFGGVISVGGFRVLVHECGLVREALWFDRPEVQALARQKEVPRVELGGRRIRVPRMADATAAAFDVLVGQVLARIDKRGALEEYTLLLAGGDATGGVFAMSRLAYDAPQDGSIEDIAKTAFALLGADAPARLTGRAYPLGAPIERKPESVQDLRPAEMPEEPTIDSIEPAIGPPRSG